VHINQVKQYLVRGKIAFSGSTFENLPVDFIVKIVIEQLFFFQAFEDLVFPEQVPLQPVRLMNFEHKYYISHGICLCIFISDNTLISNLPFLAF
jgi:hypothetical protein